MFAAMQTGLQNNVNPRNVLQAIVDEDGNKFEVGCQKDISCFNALLISRIVDAFKAANRDAREQEQAKINESQNQHFG